MVGLRLVLEIVGNVQVAVFVTQLWRREQCDWCPLNKNSGIDVCGILSETQVMELTEHIN